MDLKTAQARAKGIIIVRDRHVGEKRIRAKKPKVRTGCFTCKARRIKCDEGKPTCKRCENFGLSPFSFPSQHRIDGAKDTNVRATSKSRNQDKNMLALDQLYHQKELYFP
jgi:hypothetical protein